MTDIDFEKTINEGVARYREKEGRRFERCAGRCFKKYLVRYDTHGTSISKFMIFTIPFVVAYRLQQSLDKTKQTISTTRDYVHTV